MTILQEFPDSLTIGERFSDEQKQERARKVGFAKYALACEVVRDLDVLKPKPVFERPAGVPMDDVEVWSTIRVVSKRGERALADDREVAKDATEWLRGIHLAEVVSAANLRVLVKAMRTFEDAGSWEVDEDIARIRTHVFNCWDVDVEEAPTERDKLEQWCADACRNEGVAPTWLVNHGRPPGKLVPLVDGRSDDDGGEASDGG